MTLKGFLGKFCLFSFLCSATFAALVIERDEYARSINETLLVEKRALGDSENTPFPATFNIAGWENIAEENCYVMLCLLNGKRTFQRQLTLAEGELSYTASGARYKAFMQDFLTIRHTSQINPTTISAEEFPWRSIHNADGATRYVLPATRAEQSRQGASLMNTYNNGPSRIEYTKWFRVTFTGAPFGPFCTALHATPPDTSVCRTNQEQTLFGTAAVILANFVFQFVRTGRPPYYFVHSAGPDKGKREVNWDHGVALEAHDDYHS